MTRRPRVLYVMGALTAHDLGEEVVTTLGRLSDWAFEPIAVTMGGEHETSIRDTKARI